MSSRQSSKKSISSNSRKPTPPNKNKSKSPYSTQKKFKKSDGSAVNMSSTKNKENIPHTVDNRKLKRKSISSFPISLEEKEIDTEKLDSIVDKLFAKFVLHYNYENIFKIPEELKQDSKISPFKEKEDVDFNKKLDTYFNIYKIKISQERCLISNSEEGSYLLKHPKIWIIFIKNLKENYKFKFHDLFDIFNFALDYDVDEYLLFDYFISLPEEYEEKEVLDANVETLPSKFVELYNKNKDMILTKLKTEEASESEELLKSNPIENNINPSSNEVLNEELQNISFGNYAQENKAEEIELGVDFSFMRNKDSSTNNDCVVLVENEVKQEDSFNKYLELNTPRRISVINEASGESDDEEEKNLQSIKQSVKRINNKILKTEEKKIKVNPMAQFSNHKSNDKVDTSRDLDDALVSNKTDNFAVLELSAKSQKKVGNKFVLTPLKRQVYSNSKERKSLDTELDEIKENFHDYLYHPYDEKLVRKINEEDK